MRNIILLVCLSFLSFYVRGQFQDANLEPGDTFAFVKASIMNTDNSPYVGEVIFQGEKPYHRVVVKTAKNGWCKAKVPISDTYTLYCGRDEPAFRKAKVGNFPFVTSQVRTYTHRFVRFNFTYTNPQGKPLVGEEVIVRSTSTAKTYMDSTNKNGIAVFDLPFDPSFDVSVKYFDNLKTLVVKDFDKEYKVMNMGFTWIGAKEKERRARVADSLAQAYYAEIVAKIDSMLKNGNIDDVLIEDVMIPLGYDSTEWVVEILKKKAELYKKKLALNKQFFKNQQKTVLSVLYRLKDKFRQKIIVTDITCSMDSYMEEVLLWHAMNLADGVTTKYLFFNDGDGIANSKKEIGKTGGLHYCEGQIKDFATIVKTIRHGKSFGCSGDSQENDLEALVFASNKKNKLEELILVADNFSPIRDIELLIELKVPIRIIACGVENSNLWTDINEEYLQIAYETGGSIHTLHSDIYDLYKMVEGNSIQIDGVEYILENGKFRKRSKL